MTITRAQVVCILQTLTELNVSVSAFVISLLESPHEFSQFPVNDLAAHFTTVLATSLAHPSLNPSIILWASTLCTERLKQSVVLLSKEEHCKLVLRAEVSPFADTMCFIPHNANNS
jgi:hypothetical protein